MPTVSVTTLSPGGNTPGNRRRRCGRPARTRSGSPPGGRSRSRHAPRGYLIFQVLFDLYIARGVRGVPVLAPLPDVAVHVVKAPPVRGGFPYRMSFTTAIT